MQVMTQQKTIIMEIPLVYLYALLPIMGTTMILRTIQVMYQDFHELRTAPSSEKMTDAADEIQCLPSRRKPRTRCTIRRHTLMESSHVIILLILLGCLATYIPVFMCLFFTAVLGFLLFTDLPLLLLAQTLFRSLDNFALVVVLFFILCGNIMTTGTIVEKLIKMANALVSWLPGGLGMAGVIACALFGAISGSTVATVVALGGFMIPALIEKGYPKNYTVGLMTTSGNLGVIIPPSISMILYCMISNVSLEGLFLTGYIPGILITFLICGYTYFLFRKNTGHRPHDRSPAPARCWLSSKKGSGL